MSLPDLIFKMTFSNLSSRPPLDNKSADDEFSVLISAKIFFLLLNVSAAKIFFVSISSDVVGHLKIKSPHIGNLCAICYTFTYITLFCLRTLFESS